MILEATVDKNDSVSTSKPQNVKSKTKQSKEKSPPASFLMAQFLLAATLPAPQVVKSSERQRNQQL